MKHILIFSTLIGLISIGIVWDEFYKPKKYEFISTEIIKEELCIDK